MQSVEPVPGVLSAACAAACAAASGSCVQPSVVIASVGVSAVAGLGMKELRGESWPAGLALIFAQRAPMNARSLYPCGGRNRQRSPELMCSYRRGSSSQTSNSSGSLGLSVCPGARRIFLVSFRQHQQERRRTSFVVLDPKKKSSESTRREDALFRNKNDEAGNKEISENNLIGKAFLGRPPFVNPVTNCRLAVGRQYVNRCRALHAELYTRS